MQLQLQITETLCGY